MIGVREYINNLGRKLLFSEMLFEQNAVVGGVNSATKNWSEQKATHMLIHTINLSVPTAAGLFATITDQFGRVILSFAVDANFSGQYHLEEVIETQRLEINCSNVNVRFTVSYQYMSIANDIKE